MSKKYPAFTLIEILVVATIIIVLAAISIGSFSGANKSAKDTKRKSDLETIKQAMVLYKTQIGTYPAGVASVVATLLIGAKTISPPFPVDPTGVSYQESATETSFCFCAALDAGKGGNKATDGCGVADWIAGGDTAAYYCVQQPY